MGTPYNRIVCAPCIHSLLLNQTMEITTKITLKKALADNPELAKLLNTRHSEVAVTRLAEITELTEIFIKQNLNTIKRWID
jgi:hypothetical protein